MICDMIILYSYGGKRKRYIYILGNYAAKSSITIVSTYPFYRNVHKEGSIII